MLLKETIALFTFITGLFTISGFAVKVDKFENNHIFKNPENNQTQMILPLESFYKLKLRSGEHFKYWVENEQKVKRISQITTHNNHATLIFDDSQTSNNQLKLESVKYYLESRSFWINLFK